MITIVTTNHHFPPPPYSVPIVYRQSYSYSYRSHYGGGDRVCKSSSKAFIFSFINRDNLGPFQSKLYRNTHNAICSKFDEGPSFSTDIRIKDFAGKNKISESSLGYTYKPPVGYSYGEQKTKSLLAGSEHFQPDEIEVFYEV